MRIGYIYRFLIVLIAAQPCLFMLNAQHSLIAINGKSYFSEGEKWFTRDRITNEKFEIDTKRMTVKLQNDSHEDSFMKLCIKLNVIIENVNILGYYDLILPDSLMFYQNYENLQNSNLFSSIEILSFPKIMAPDDPKYADGSQYYLQNSIDYPDINMEAAWSSETGDPSIIVAVIDEGVDNDHTDLNANIWSGYGWDYVGDDSNPDPSDSAENHGTSVAGIIAAETDNNLAIAGIAQDCKIMSIRVFGYENGTYIKESQNIDDAIIYAANNGAKIINMSFALDALSDFTTYKSSVDAAIEYAYETKGCLLVASSGNNASLGIFYPARHSDVMAVGGITQLWENYGNNGSEQEIVAPAKGIYSLLTSTSQDSDKSGLFNLSGNGTSAAAPQVAGVAALIYSKYSNWINFDVRKILNESARDLNDQTKFGNGLILADTALINANPTYQANNNQPQNLTLSGSYGSNPTITWDEIGGNDIDDYYIYRAKKISGVYTHFSHVAAVYPSGNSTNSWTDNEVIRQSPRTATSTHYYRVTSLDVYERESVTSNEVSTGSNWMNKENDSKSEDLEYEYNLGNNYPNPFNPSTKIKYSLKSKGLVTIRIYDVLGRLVKELVNEQRAEGQYEVIFNTKNLLSSGIYYYTMKVNEFSNSKKLIILK